MVHASKKGFANVTEDTLYDLILSKDKKKIPKESQLAGDAKLELTFAAMSCVTPNIHLEDAIKNVHTGFNISYLPTKMNQINEPVGCNIF